MLRIEPVPAVVRAMNDLAKVHKLRGIDSIHLARAL